MPSILTLEPCLANNSTTTLATQADHGIRFVYHQFKTSSLSRYCKLRTSICSTPGPRQFWISLHKVLDTLKINAQTAGASMNASSTHARHA